MADLIAPLGLETFDLITGTKHDDSLTGTAGDDKMSGLGGDDVLGGATGDDTLIGGAGDDTLKGGTGNDLLKGGAGLDYADYSNSSGVTLDFHHAVSDSGTDTLKSIDGALLGDGADMVTGTRWDNIVYDSGGHNVMDMGAGDDQVWLAGAEGSTIEGGDGADMLRGGEGADVLSGGQGDDTLLGGAGDDSLVTYSGSDRADGGAGNDTLFDSQVSISDQVSLYGGDGDDVINLYSGEGGVVDGGAGYDTIVGFNPGWGLDISLDDARFQNVEAVLGSDSSFENDVIHGHLDQANHIDGRAGSDQIWGGDLGDVLIGGGASDGGDNITGGGGADTLTGGGGGDGFIFVAVSDSASDAPDLITDLEDDDTIYLNLIDADTTKAGDQAFVVVHHLTHRAGQLAVSYDAASGLTSIAGDVDGDGHADFLIQAEGDHSHHDGFFL